MTELIAKNFHGFVAYKQSLLIAYIIFSCTGMHLMKKAVAIKSIKYALGLTIFGTSSIMWLIYLRIAPLAASFPIATGLLTLGTILTGKFMLHEDIGCKRAKGIFLIVIGIILVGNK